MAAVLLFVCIVGVALENAVRKRAEQSGRAVEAFEPARQRMGQTVGVLVTGHNAYTWIARLTLIAGGVALVLWWNDWITLFLLEVIVFLFLVAFWSVQTVEQGTKPPGAEHVKERVGTPGGTGD